MSFKLSWLLLLILFSILFDNKLVSEKCLTDQRDLLLQLNQSLTSRGRAIRRGCNPIYSNIYASLSKRNIYNCRGGSYTKIGPLPSTLKRRSWSLNTDCCSAWDGVNCDTDGHVISLDLSGEFLYDGLDNSSSLFKLQHLQNLDLSDNDFQPSQIPSGWFDRLTNLTNLNLSDAGYFTGKISIEISRLTKLVSLDLSFASIEIPDIGALIRNLSELRVLRLHGVNISADGRKWCQAVSSSLPKLQVLSLSHCSLSGPIDNSLLQLRSLHEITLDGNNISTQVPDFLMEFSNLTSLSLSYCGLYGKFPEKLLQLQTLQSLNLAGNRLLYGSLPEFPQNGSLQRLLLMNTNFSGELPNSIGNLKLLSHLDLGYCGFNGELPNSIGNLKLLSHLDLRNCGFNGSIPDSVTKLDQLQFLDLSSNRLTDLIPLFWNKLVKLSDLNLGNNSLNGSISPSLFTLPSLENLYLSQNQFTGRLAKFPNGSSPLLVTLDLSSNKLEGPISPSLFTLPSLEQLDLSQNQFTGRLVVFPNGTSPLLVTLDLSSNKLEGPISPSLFTLPSLEYLDLSQNQFMQLETFILPDCFRNSSRLTYLDLSSNHIRGKVPNWIWMSGLQIYKLNLSKNFFEDLEQPLLDPIIFNGSSSMGIVDLSFNMLQGNNLLLLQSQGFLIQSPYVLDYSNNNLSSVIPHNISSYIPKTTFFSLSSNNLIGEIPASICECSNLEVLDLSTNSLSGSIPQCMGTMKYLGVLNLGGNYFHGTIPHMFQEGCSLRTLSLNTNRLVGKVARSLANCKVLEVLDLGNNQINGIFPSWLGNMSNLRVLILRSNRFNGPLRHRRTTDQNFQMLQIIDISSNNFTGNLSLEFFSSLKAMMINKEDNKTSGENQILRYEVSNVYKLYYDSVTVVVKGKDVELVKILTIFTSIDLSNNGFEGDIPEVLGSLSSLYALNVSHNALTGGIPSSFGNLRQLESLDLSQNKLNGEIPLQLAGLTFLSSLNLSYNHLVGKIPLSTQIQSFNATSFEGNDGLCGLPLTKKCINNGTEPPTISPSPSKSMNEFNWMPISVASGFCVGIGISICLMTFWGTRVRRSSRH